MLVDSASVTAAFASHGHLLRRGIVAPSQRYWPLGLIVLIWLGALWILGFYSSARYLTWNRIAYGLVKVHILTGTILLGIIYWCGCLRLSLLEGETFLVLSFGVFLAQKLSLRYVSILFPYGLLPRHKRVLVIGMPMDAERYRKLLENHASMHAELVGVLVPPGHHGAADSNGSRQRDI